MKIATILGTRPEITKLSPLLPLLKKKFDSIIVHTGQHYDYEMDEIFFSELKLSKPDFNLKVGSASAPLQLSTMLEKIEEILSEKNPEMVIVLGDTNTTLAGALAASKMSIPVMHIEAGCRSFNKAMPEEQNRIITDHISSILICPDENAVKNALNEGIHKSKIQNLGSLAIDACLRNKEIAKKSRIGENLGISSGKFILATVHRAENTNSKEILADIINAFNELAEKMQIVWPVHPRTKKMAESYGITISPKIKSISAVGYLEFLWLLENCSFAMTDSGGVQEEAVCLNTPCVILRNETEWTRYVKAGKNILAGNKKEGILSAASKLTDNPSEIDAIKSKKCDLVKEVGEKIVRVIENASKNS